MKILVTGATGRLGSVVCPELLRRGHDVLGSDQRFAPSAVALRLADLRDPHAAHGLLEGCDAVVHLGNIPSLGVGPSPQVVLAENVAMNTNVFRAAVDRGVKRIVFASSLQAMIRLEEGGDASSPPQVPYFPLDGAAKANPGFNFYGLSKELGERTLQVLSERFPELCCTVLRFPMLVGDWFRKRLQRPLARAELNLREGLTYLDFSDAATLVALVLERQQPGYHQYFPAQALQLAGYDAAGILAEFFPDTPLTRPARDIAALVEHGALERDFDFRPPAPLTVQLERL